uniref:SMODS-associated and fused to various effectors domain-containing protein n=1 Tax=Burkholderia sp. (strain CCGE1003) TaxID=640512 RepID=E1TJ83_BURSG
MIPHFVFELLSCTTYSTPMLTHATMDDSELATALGEVGVRARALHLVVDGFRSAVFVQDISSDNWRCVGRGDFAELSLKAIRPLISKTSVRFSKVADVSKLAERPFLKSDAEEKGSVRSLSAWIRSKAELTAPKGRQGGLSSETKRKVERAAQWRCQFEGCGEDLREHPQTGADGNFSYLAHIVAASPDGPRGDTVLSAQLVDDPSNIMLMCDRCHRLIDRVSPDSFTVERLRAMRQAHVAEVNRLMEGLRFPAAQPVVIGGNIAGQYAQFDTAGIAAAMREQKLRASGPPQAFFRNAAHMGNNVADHYWASLFEQMGADLPALRRFLNGDERAGVTPESICVFPLHNTSTLVLAGRVTGEARNLSIFQYDRDALPGSPGGKWGWRGALRPAADKFRVEVDCAAAGPSVDGTLLLYVTAAVPTAELPEPIQRDGALAMPTVRITIDNPGYSAVAHPEDLRLFGVAVGQALRILADEWRVQRIHVVAVAPASACFRFGQKLQARNQAAIRLYERAPAGVSGTPAPRPFMPTIDISSDAVRLPGGTHSIALL